RADRGGSGQQLNGQRKISWRGHVICLAERGHSCPQQRASLEGGPDSGRTAVCKLLRTGMSALRARRVRGPGLAFFMGEEWSGGAGENQYYDKEISIQTASSP